MAVLHCWIGVVWLLSLTNELKVHFTVQEHSDETKKFWQSNFRHKLAWTMNQHDVSPARVINADETCVRLLPANTYGGSTVGSKASQLRSSKAAITGTLAVPMDATTPLCLQLIFGGQDGRVFAESRPYFRQVSGDPFCASSKHTVNTSNCFVKPPLFIGVHQPYGEPLADGVLSLEDFMVFLDLKLNWRGARGLDLRA